MNRKAEDFRRLLRRKKSILLGGAHDALSAKLIEEAGYDAVWASSFGISASTKCLPDANVLTMTEAFDAIKGMNEAVSIPLIADCDNGYGNAHNVIRMVREYQSAGIAGISIEDNPFPKKCSLYPGERPELVPIEEMAGRIHAAKATQRGRDFFVIARTEALIAGLGMEEALERARAYEEAGADAILIHSRQATPHEISTFARRWKGKIPLVAVPTKYPDVNLKRLGNMGIRIVIFANQALRASVVAMRETLRAMKRAGSIGGVQKKIAPLSDIFKLVGQPDLEANDLRFVKNFKKGPTAVILAAGFEKNFWPLNSDRPKALLGIQGRSILQRQVDILRRQGIERIAVVTGYRGEKIRMPSLVTYHNPRFENTHMLYSLFCARPELEDKFIFLYGDVLFDDSVLEKLLRSRRDITLVTHRLNARRFRNGSKSETDWVQARPDERGELIVQIGHHLGPVTANGEFIGLAMFSKRGAGVFRKTYDQLLRRNGHSKFHNAPNLHQAQFTDLIQELINRKEKVYALPIQSGWLDIDSFEDYQEAWKEISQ